MLKNLIPSLCAALLSILLSSCASQPRAYYVLTPDGPAPSGGGPGIGVGPVSVADYLDRQNLIVQQDANQFGIAEDHRWAGDLANTITRVTATNLGRRLSTGNVRSYPWTGDDGLRYQVTIDIRQLHAGSDGYAIIEAGWRAYALPGSRIIASRTFTDREPLTSDGYQPLVAAQSRLLSRLADDIASSLR